MLPKIFKWIKQHKIILCLIIMMAIGAGFLGYKKIKGGIVETRYTLAVAKKGNVIVSVSGSGQISALNQVDIKPKVSGDITYINLESGQSIKAGALMAELDKTDAQDAIDSAKEILEEEQLTLDKMMGLVTTGSGTIRGDKEKAEDTLDKAYEDGFNNVSSVFLSLPNIMSGFYDLLYSADISSVQQNISYYADTAKKYDDSGMVSQYKTEVDSKYQVARTAYNKNFENYKTTTRFSDEATIEFLIDETYETVKSVSDAIKSANNLIQFYQDKLTEHQITVNTLSTTHLSALNTYTGSTNTFLSNLLTNKTNIQSDKEALIEVGFNIADQEKKVADAKKSLKDAEDELENYSVYAPFGGTIAAVSAEMGDSVSSGTTLTTLITEQKIAEISLNEVDVANVKVDQKAILTFDALQDITLTGKVYEVDEVGTVSQGVVSYGVKISLDTENNQVKPGMTVSAAIITNTKQDVLLIPASAVKSFGSTYYVEVLSNSDISDEVNSSSVTSKNPPTKKEIIIGLSDDSSMEILSGLEEGDMIITKTIISSLETKTTSTSSTINNSAQGGLFEMGGGGPPR